MVLAYSLEVQSIVTMEKTMVVTQAGMVLEKEVRVLHPDWQRAGREKERKRLRQRETESETETKRQRERDRD